jgi:hypothetical protein
MYVIFIFLLPYESIVIIVLLTVFLTCMVFCGVLVLLSSLYVICRILNVVSLSLLFVSRIMRNIYVCSLYLATTI